MRKSEITPELIQLSKSAKELGVSQDVGEGDWVCINNPITKKPFNHPELVSNV